jgi:hypothetical protein
MVRSISTALAYDKLAYRPIRKRRLRAPMIGALVSLTSERVAVKIVDNSLRSSEQA